jgi:hypothetical protein
LIGIDPHKATHTAVAVDDNEVMLDEFRLRASAVQAERLLEWAAGFEKREWVVESANGLGYLVAQQLVAAGETVFDVPSRNMSALPCASATTSGPFAARVAQVSEPSAPVPLVTRLPPNRPPCGRTRHYRGSGRDGVGGLDQLAVLSQLSFTGVGFWTIKPVGGRNRPRCVE